MFARRHIEVSEIGSIFGVDPSKSIFDLYHEKALMKEVSKSLDLNTLESAEKCCCFKLNSLVAQIYEKIMNQSIFVTGLFNHSKYPFLVVNHEQVMFCRGRGFNIKIVNDFEELLKIYNLCCLEAIYCMAVTDLPVWDIGLLVGIENIKVYSFERDKQAEKIIVEFIANFWNNHVLPRIPLNENDHNQKLLEFSRIFKIKDPSLTHIKLKWFKDKEAKKNNFVPKTLLLQYLRGSIEKH